MFVKEMFKMFFLKKHSLVFVFLLTLFFSLFVSDFHLLSYWRGTFALVTASTYKVDQQKKDKWTEIRPFFEEFEQKYAKVLWVKLVLDNKDYYVNSLVENSGDNAIDDWDNEALMQLNSFVVNDIKLDRLEAALSDAETQAERQWQQYRNVLKDYQNDPIIQKTINSQLNRVLTIDNGHFQIADILQENATEEQQKNLITIFILAKVTPQQIKQAIEKYIPNSIKFWKLFQPVLHTNKRRTQSGFSSIILKQMIPYGALDQQSSEKDYYSLTGAAKFQLWAFVRNDKVNPNQLIAEFEKIVLGKNFSQTTATTEETKEKNKNRDLAIGLGTAGGVLAFAGVGGFVYWFFKIRKS